jgi:hypothetical protein
MNTSSSSEDDDPLREARAYNNSIYLMLSMPYLLLGIIGFKVYRICKKRNDDVALPGHFLKKGTGSGPHHQ